MEYLGIEEQGVVRVKKCCFTFSWTIENIFPKFTRVKPRKCIKSPVFTTIFNRKFEWQIQLFPNGYNRESRGLWSVYVLNRTNQFFLAAVVINVLINNEKMLGVNEYKEQWTNLWKFENVLKLKKVKQMLLKWKNITNSVIITCEISKPTHEATIQSQINTISRLEEFDDFEGLLDNDVHSDITLLVCGAIFPAHKCILSRKSPIFAAMFKRDKLKNQKNVILDDVKPDVTKELVTSWEPMTASCSYTCR